jgi:hypothetical protein
MILVCGVISEAAWDEFAARTREVASEDAGTVKIVDGEPGTWTREAIPVPEFSEDGMKVEGYRTITRDDRKCWRLRFVGS